jgi:hypothetical protein
LILLIGDHALLLGQRLLLGRQLLLLQLHILHQLLQVRLRDRLSIIGPYGRPGHTERHATRREQASHAYARPPDATLIPQHSHGDNPHARMQH